MTTESVFDQMKESLNGQPGQPIVLGVCNALAERYNKEPWVFRLVAIVLLIAKTLPMLIVYVVLGFVLSETEARTRQFFSGLAVVIREGVDKLAASLRGALGETSRNRT